MAHPKLAERLNGFEDRMYGFDYHDVASALIESLPPREEYEFDKEDLGEIIAFQLVQGYPEGEDHGGWGKYYGPFSIMGGMESPSIKRIDSAMIEYWKERAGCSKSPLMSLRYADLALEFGSKADHVLASQVARKTLEVVEHGGIEPLLGFSMLERAIDVVKRFRNGLDVKYETLGDALVRFEENSPDELPGLWGNAFETLILGASSFKPKPDWVSLLPEKLWNRIRRLNATEGATAYCVEYGTELLLRYYKPEANRNEILAILAELEKAYRKDSHLNSSGMLKSDYLGKLLSLHTKYKMLDGGDGINRFGLELIRVCRTVPDEMQSFTLNAKITKSQIDSIIRSHYGKDDSPFGIRKSVAKMLGSFLCYRKRTEKTVRERAKKFVFLNLLNQTMISGEGLPIASLGPFESDFDRHVDFSAGEDLHHGSTLFILLIREFFKKFTPMEILAWFKDSRVFEDRDLYYVEKVIKELVDGDFLAASSIQIPLIESSLRNLAVLSGTHVLAESRDFPGSYEFVSMERLFDSEMFEKAYGTELGNDVRFTFRLILTNSLGMNLRNTFCHGTNMDLFRSEHVAYRLFFLLLTLSGCARKPDEINSTDASLSNSPSS